MKNNARALLIKVVTTILVVLIIGYGFFAARDLIRGPSIQISEPADGYTTASSTVLIAGKALRVQGLSLNGSPVEISLDGDFRERILLKSGVNRILAKGHDKFNRETEVFIQVVRKNLSI